MSYRKITPGYVYQRFNNEGVFISQAFVANDTCEYENERTSEIILEGDMPLGGDEYFPFKMKQER